MHLISQEKSLAWCFPGSWTGKVFQQHECTLFWENKTLSINMSDIWEKSIQNGPGEICGRQQTFKLGCLQQILLGPFLNTLSHLQLLFRIF